jgi:hypothetical protein
MAPRSRAASSRASSFSGAAGAVPTERRRVAPFVHERPPERSLRGAVQSSTTSRSAASGFCFSTNASAPGDAVVCPVTPRFGEAKRVRLDVGHARIHARGSVTERRRSRLLVRSERPGGRSLYQAPAGPRHADHVAVTRTAEGADLGYGACREVVFDCRRLVVAEHPWTHVLARERRDAGRGCGRGVRALV